jgi:hypothetical protein
LSEKESSILGLSPCQQQYEEDAELIAGFFPRQALIPLSLWFFMEGSGLSESITLLRGFFGMARQ